jgi:O-antigen ligase/tetratricopeptide (TPR) repeat protein
MFANGLRVVTKVRSTAHWRVSILLLLMVSLLVPVIVPSGFFFPYVFPRNIFFRVVVEIATLVLAFAVCFGNDDLDLRYEPIFWAIAAFVFASWVSAVFSPARNHSLFGDFERMGGVWAWLHLTLFFVLLRTLRDDDWPWVLNSALVVSLFVSAAAIGEHFRLVASATPEAAMVSGSAATIGNSGLLAAYLLFGLGIAGYLAATNAHRLKAIYLVAAAIELTALIYAENRSTGIGLVLGGIVGSMLYAMLRTKHQRRWLPPIVAVALACLVAAATIGIRQSPSGGLTRLSPALLQRLAFTNRTGGDDSRLMQWRAALDGFRDRPFLGYGPENHNLVWSAHLDPGIYRIDTDIYDRTHNQYLEVLATGGVLGALALLAIWLAIGVTLVRAYRDQRLSPASLAVLTGLQVAYATYLFFWFFDLNSTMLWLMFGALISSRENAPGVVRPSTDTVVVQRRVPIAVTLAATLVVGVSLYAEAYLPFLANRALDRLDPDASSVAEAVGHIGFLTHTRIGESAHAPIIMAEYLDGIRPQFASIRRDPMQRRMLETAFRDALLANREEIHRDTLNDRLYTARASVLLDAADFYGSGPWVDDAIESLDKAIDLSPHRLQPRMALAQVYWDDREFQRAKQVLTSAVTVDSALGEPRYRMAQYYLHAGKTDSALSWLVSSLDRGYVGTPDTYLAVGKRLEFAGRSTRAADLYTSYLEAKYTRAVWNGSATIDRAVPAADIAVAAHLPLLYVRAQDRELAIKTAAALSAFDSSRTELVERFVSDLGSRRRSRWVAKNSLLPCGPSRTSRASDPDRLAACGVFRRKL